MELLKAYNKSGGATKIVGEFGVTEQLLSSGIYKPNLLAGTSAGALIDLIIPTVNWDDPWDAQLQEYKHFLLHLQNEDIWKVSPLTKDGGISIAAIWRIIRSKSSLGNMNNLKQNIKGLITKKLFNKYIRYNSKYIGIFVNTVCYNTGARIYKNIKLLDYEDAIDWVIGSASIPVFTEPLQIKNDFFYDGGVRDHMPGAWILSHIPNIIESVSIFSRPKDMDIKIEDWKPKNIYEVLTRTIDIMNLEISKSDEREERLLAQQKGIKLTQLFLPKVLESLYDLNRDRIIQLYHEGIKLGETYK